MGRWPKSSRTSRDSRITQDPILALGLAIFLAGLINGTTGMGFAQLAAAGLALVMDVKSAVVLLSIMVPITAGMQLVQHRAQTSHFGRALPLLAAGLLGVPLGVALLAFLPSRVMPLRWAPLRSSLSYQVCEKPASRHAPAKNACSRHSSA